MNIYKHLNLFFYRFGQFLLVGGTLAFPFGLIYLVFASFTDAFTFDLNTFIFSILYMLIPMVTGKFITEEYIDSNSKKNKRKSKNKFIQLKIEK